MVNMLWFAARQSVLILEGGSWKLSRKFLDADLRVNEEEKKKRATPTGTSNSVHRLLGFPFGTHPEPRAKL